MYTNKTLIALGILFFSSQVQAAQDSYSFDWLDPDKKIYVLQNRKFQKKNHLMVSAMGGLSSTNAYLSSYQIDGRIGFYFTEEFGFEGVFEQYFHRVNNTYVSLQNQMNTNPNVREIQQQFGGLLHWTPWYGKMNWFNAIIYFDWYFAGGMGGLSTRLDTNADVDSSPLYVDEQLFSFYLGTGHLYHLTELIFVRLDFLSAIYRASPDTNTEQVWTSHYAFSAGIGLRF